MFPFIMIVDREKWDNSLLTRFKTFLSIMYLRNIHRPFWLQQ